MTIPVQRVVRRDVTPVPNLMKTVMKPGRQPPAVFQQSRRLRRPRSGDTERVRALLNRLQAIVPAAPKDRQLPQVQVIQHVINYICQLQHQVVKHPRLGKIVTAEEVVGEAEGRVAARLAIEEKCKADNEEERKAGKRMERGAIMEVDGEAASGTVTPPQVSND